MADPPRSYPVGVPAPASNENSLHPATDERVGFNLQVYPSLSHQRPLGPFAGTAKVETVSSAPVKVLDNGKSNLSSLPSTIPELNDYRTSLSHASNISPQSSEYLSLLAPYPARQSSLITTPSSSFSSSSESASDSSSPSVSPALTGATPATDSPQGHPPSGNAFVRNNAINSSQPHPAPDLMAAYLMDASSLGLGFSTSEPTPPGYSHSFANGRQYLRPPIFRNNSSRSMRSRASRGNMRMGRPLSDILEFDGGDAGSSGDEDRLPKNHSRERLNAAGQYVFSGRERYQGSDMASLPPVFETEGGHQPPAMVEASLIAPRPPSQPAPPPTFEAAATVLSGTPDVHTPVTPTASANLYFSSNPSTPAGPQTSQSAGSTPTLRHSKSFSLFGNSVKSVFRSRSRSSSHSEVIAGSGLVTVSENEAKKKRKESPRKINKKKPPSNRTTKEPLGSSSNEMPSERELPGLGDGHSKDQESDGDRSTPIPSESARPRSSGSPNSKSRRLFLSSPAHIFKRSSGRQTDLQNRTDSKSGHALASRSSPDVFSTRIDGDLLYPPEQTQNSRQPDFQDSLRHPTSQNVSQTSSTGSIEKDETLEKPDYLLDEAGVPPKLGRVATPVDSMPVSPEKPEEKIALDLQVETNIEPGNDSSDEKANGFSDSPPVLPPLSGLSSSSGNGILDLDLDLDLGPSFASTMTLDLKSKDLPRASPMISSESVDAEGGNLSDSSSSSTGSLTRKAEFLLANAKKRLSQMEGNLRGARTSLMLGGPTNSRPQSGLSHRPGSTVEPLSTLSGRLPLLLTSSSLLSQSQSRSRTSLLSLGPLSAGSSNGSGPVSPRLPTSTESGPNPRRIWTKIVPVTTGGGVLPDGTTERKTVAYRHLRTVSESSTASNDGPAQTAAPRPATATGITRSLTTSTIPTGSARPRPQSSLALGRQSALANPFQFRPLGQGGGISLKLPVRPSSVMEGGNFGFPRARVIGSGLVEKKAGSKTNWAQAATSALDGSGSANATVQHVSENIDRKEPLAQPIQSFGAETKSSLKTEVSPAEREKDGTVDLKGSSILEHSDGALSDKPQDIWESKRRSFPLVSDGSGMQLPAGAVTEPQDPLQTSPAVASNFYVSASLPPWSEASPVEIKAQEATDPHQSDGNEFDVDAVVADCSMLQFGSPEVPFASRSDADLPILSFSDSNESGLPYLVPTQTSDDRVLTEPESLKNSKVASGLQVRTDLAEGTYKSFDLLSPVRPLVTDDGSTFNRQPSGLSRAASRSPGLASHSSLRTNARSPSSADMLLSQVNELQARIAIMREGVEAISLSELGIDFAAQRTYERKMREGGELSEVDEGEEASIEREERVDRERGRSNVEDWLARSGVEFEDDGEGGEREAGGGRCSVGSEEETIHPLDESLETVGLEERDFDRADAISLEAENQVTEQLIRHEDRPDAFDYETFYLHSLLGSIKPTSFGRRSSVSSGNSNDTARALGQQDGFEGNAGEPTDETVPGMVAQDIGKIHKGPGGVEDGEDDDLDEEAELDDAGSDTTERAVGEGNWISSDSLRTDSPYQSPRLTATSSPYGNAPELISHPETFTISPRPIFSSHSPGLVRTMSHTSANTISTVDTFVTAMGPDGDDENASRFQSPISFYGPSGSVNGHSRNISIDSIATARPSSRSARLGRMALYRRNSSLSNHAEAEEDKIEPGNYANHFTSPLSRSRRGGSGGSGSHSDESVNTLDGITRDALASVQLTGLPPPLTSLPTGPGLPPRSSSLTSPVPPSLPPTVTLNRPLSRPTSRNRLAEPRSRSARSSPVGPHQHQHYGMYEANSSSGSGTSALSPPVSSPPLGFGPHGKPGISSHSRMPGAFDSAPFWSRPGSAADSRYEARSLSPVPGRGYGSVQSGSSTAPRHQERQQQQHQQQLPGESQLLSGSLPVLVEYGDSDTEVAGSSHKATPSAAGDELEHTDASGVLSSFPSSSSPLSSALLSQMAVRSLSPKAKNELMLSLLGKALKGKTLSLETLDKDAVLQTSITPRATQNTDFDHHKAGLSRLDDSSPSIPLSSLSGPDTDTLTSLSIGLGIALRQLALDGGTEASAEGSNSAQIAGGSDQVRIALKKASEMVWEALATIPDIERQIRQINQPSG